MPPYQEIILELTQREQYLSMLVKIQKSLLDSSLTDNWYDYILPILGQTSLSSRASFYKNHLSETGELLTSHLGEWCAPNISSVKDNPILHNMSYESFSPYWLEHLKKDSSLVVPTIATPQKERELLESLQVVSFMLLPLMVNQQLFGFISLSDCHEIRVWSNVEIDMLWAAIASVSIYLERIQAEIAFRAINEKLQRLANLDGLTRIANRRKFDQHLNQEWRHMERIQAPLALILCDIDYFKLYNDTKGHQAGDECLQQVAQTLDNLIRRSSDLVARYGGEEFAIILSATPINRALQIAQIMKNAIEILQIPHPASEVSSYVTVSMGVSSLIPSHELSPKTLVARADAALYRAKTAGRNQIAI